MGFQHNLLKSLNIDVPDGMPVDKNFTTQEVVLALYDAPSEDGRRLLDTVFEVITDKTLSELLGPS